MQITEVFYSLQGEGRRMGKPTVFIRSTGCHLRCSWCDAEYTFTGGSKKSVEELVGNVLSFPTKDVCFTGGEPLLQKDAWELVDALLDRHYHVLIETSGNIDFSDANQRARRDLIAISMDIKCPSSGEHEKNTPEKMADLTEHDQLKFVIADRADYDYAKEILAEFGWPPCPVYFNPVDGVEPAKITAWLLAEPEPVPVHVGVQLHKLIWGNEPGR